MSCPALMMGYPGEVLFVGHLRLALSVWVDRGLIRIRSNSEPRCQIRTCGTTASGSSALTH